MIIHPIEPVYDKDSKILILGSFPSVKSRETGFYYGHPQNRFWKVLASLFDEDLPHSNEDKKEFLLRNHIAVWDVIGSCEIEGSSDSSIRNAVVNDIDQILQRADIIKICVNGKTAERIYNRYIRSVIGREAVSLPSTSPANAAWSLDRLTEAWRKLLL